MNSIAGIDWNPAGYAALSGPLLTLYQRLDETFADWARDIGAVEYRFPSLIALEDLAPIAYLQSFPHLATFACGPSCDSQTLTDFATSYRTADKVRPDRSWDDAGQILTPAACYHFYPRLARQTLEEDTYLTTVCACHRREQDYIPLQRQWCFNMRELVCIGQPEGVEAFVIEFQQRIENLIDKFELNADWQVATDPFFDPKQDPKALAQQIEPVKQELTLDDGLAIASVNRHRAFFGECYQIYQNERPAHSACVAFGLERWLHALIRRAGSDPASWQALIAA